MNLTEALKFYFGYGEFRPGQKEIIQNIIDKKNVVAILPTGGGKSLCYQIPALISPSYSIVVSPLIALMKDQVDSINKNGTVAAFINSTMKYDEINEVINDIDKGKIKLLYVAPERLESLNFSEKMKNLKPDYLFVDEAHCISEWGHNFRPSYTKIREFKEYLQIKRVAAFTATATKEVVKDIIEQLNMSSPEVFVKGFERDNLSLNVIITKKKNQMVLDLVKEFGSPAIIYTSSRNKAEEAANYLTMHNVSSDYYHAGLNPDYRKKIQERFISGEVPVICATNAFGMGIDKSDIRLVIHYNLPGSIENYYQEIGRAGRDGKHSNVFLLYDDSDVGIQDFFIANSHPDKNLIHGVYNALCDFNKVSFGSKPDKELQLNTEYINNYMKKVVGKGTLHSALSFLEQAGYIKQLSEFDQKTSLKFLCNKDVLREFIEKYAKYKPIVVILLREYGGNLFSNQPYQISLKQIAYHLNAKEDEVIELLNNLHNYMIVDFIHLKGKENVLLTVPRVEATRLKLDYKKINDKFLIMQKKLDSIVNYVFNTSCRMKYILNYFGEDLEDYRCNKCDVCTGGKRFLHEDSFNFIKEKLLLTLYLTKGDISSLILLNLLHGTSKSKEANELETYATCANYKKEEIKEVFYQLLQKKFIAKKPESKSYFQVTELGYDFLMQNRLIKEEEQNNNEFKYTEHLELFHLLRESRALAAKKFMQKAIYICPDETLREIAIKQPLSKRDLAEIKGFSERMFNKAGNLFLEVVRDFASKEEKPKHINKSESKVPNSLEELVLLLKRKHSLEDICKIRKAPDSIVSMQIESILGYDRTIDASYLINKELLSLVFSRIKDGITDLKDLKEKIKMDVPYSILRIAVALYKQRLNIPTP